VQLFSSAAKPVEDLQHGAMNSAFSSAFDYDTHPRLQRVSDSGLLREGYEAWYKRHGGRQLEKDLLLAFNNKTLNTHLHQYCADRFSNTLRKAIELDEEEEEPELLKVCKQVISDDKRLDADSFVELHRLICEVNGISHETPTSSALKAAAARQLTHRKFTDALAQQLPASG
jgi:hypothetical protein